MIKPSRKELVECIQNLMGLIDNPVGRMKLGGTLYDEIIKESRLLLEKERGESKGINPKDYILITKLQFITLFSGSDVFLVPIEYVEESVEMIHPDSKEIIEIPETIGIIAHWDRAFRDEGFIISNGACYDRTEQILCGVAVTLEQIMWRTAPEYMSYLMKDD